MDTSSPQPASSAYPASLSVDYPDGSRNRLTTFFRILVVIPIYIVLYLVDGGALQQTYTGRWPWQLTGGTPRDINQTLLSSILSVGGILFAPTVLMILFRRKYPRWWFDWNLALFRFSTRVFLFALLLRDEYPSTDDQQAVHLDVVYPDAANDLNRWLPLVKWLLAFPHLLISVFLLIATAFVSGFAWFAIMFTGTYPRPLFAFVVGANRWFTRVYAYAFLLTTDRYPPFSLS